VQRSLKVARPPVENGRREVATAPEPAKASKCDRASVQPHERLGWIKVMYLRPFLEEEWDRMDGFDKEVARSRLGNQTTIG